MNLPSAHLDPSEQHPHRTCEPERIISYISKDDDSEYRQLESGRRIAGACLSTIATIALSFYAAAINIHLHMGVGPWPPQPLRIAEPLLAVFISYAVLGGIAFFYHRQSRSLAFGKGVLLGIGIGLVLDICVFVKYAQFLLPIVLRYH